jgi:hypothetical protein
MSLNDKARAALTRELQKAFPERSPDDAGHGRLAAALSDTARHTPGDWESVAFGDGCAINGPDGLRVAMTYGCAGEGEERANADLIAAAPSLLDALRAFVAISEPFAAEMEGDTHPDSVRGLEVLAAARAAIARATGGAK